MRLPWGRRSLTKYVPWLVFRMPYPRKKPIFFVGTSIIGWERARRTLSVLIVAVLLGRSVAHSQMIVSLATRDIAYDPVTRRIYASIPGSVAGIGNQIVPINPDTGAIEAGFPGGNEPGKLAIPSTGGKLYTIAETNSLLKRFDLVSRSNELSFVMETNVAPGVYTVEDFEILPGSPNSVAVLRLVYGFNAEIAVYDNGARRTAIASGDGDGYSEIIEASADGNSVYFQSYGVRGFRRCAVDAQGVTLSYVDSSVTPAFSAREWRAVENRLFGSDGVVIDPLVPTVLAKIPNLPQNSLLTYDATIQRVYYLVPSGANWNLQSYEASSLSPAGTMTIFNVVGTPSSLIRWGEAGLAFRTDSNRVYVIQTSLVPTNPPADPSI